MDVLNQDFPGNFFTGAIKGELSGVLKQYQGSLRLAISITRPCILGKNANINGMRR